MTNEIKYTAYFNNSTQIENGELINICDSVSSIKEIKTCIFKDIEKRKFTGNPEDYFYMYLIYEEDYSDLDFQGIPSSYQLYDFWKRL